MADVVLPGHGLLVRGRRHRDEQRAPRAARAEGARPAGRGARRHVDPLRARPPPRPRLGRADRGGDLGRVPLAVADAPRHELRAARGAGRHPVAVPGRGAALARCSCTGGCGPSRVEGPLAPFSVVEAKPPFEALDADYPIRLTTGRRLESFNTGAQSNRYRSPLHRGESLDLSPEDAERLELRKARSCASRRAAARSRRRCGSTRRCGPGSRS